MLQGSLLLLSPKHTTLLRSTTEGYRGVEIRKRVKHQGFFNPDATWCIEWGQDTIIRDQGVHTFHLIPHSTGSETKMFSIFFRKNVRGGHGNFFFLNIFLFLKIFFFGFS